MISSLPAILCHGKKICIRRFCPADAPAIFAYSQEESTRRELPDEVFDSLNDVRELLVQFNQNADCLSYPLVLCVARRTDDAAVGHVSLSPLGPDKVEIGYAIGEAHQGKGYGAEAADIFTRWVLAQENWPVLYGIVKEKNAASVRCLEKAGYRLTVREERECFGGCYCIREYVRKAE